MYSLIRILIGCIMFAIAVYLISKLNAVRKALRYILASIVTIILMLLLAFVPFENLFMTFETPEAAYKYYNWGQSQIKLVVNGQDSDFVIGSKNSSNVYLIIPKTDDGWKIGIGTNTRKIEQKIVGDIVISIYQYGHTDDYYITALDTSGASLEITDALNSSFFNIIQENAATNKELSTYYASLSGFNQEYWILINGEKIGQWNSKG